MMEATNVHILRRNESKSLTINLHHIVSTGTLDDPAVFTDFVRKKIGFITQQTIGVITNFVESFGGLLAVNDVDIDTFFKDTHSANNARAAVKRILISNNATQGIKSMCLELKDRELCNAFTGWLYIDGINA